LLFKDAAAADVSECRLPQRWSGELQALQAATRQALAADTSSPRGSQEKQLERKQVEYRGAAVAVSRDVQEQLASLRAALRSQEVRLGLLFKDVAAVAAASESCAYSSAGPASSRHRRPP